MLFIKKQIPKHLKVLSQEVEQMAGTGNVNVVCVITFNKLVIISLDSSMKELWISQSSMSELWFSPWLWDLFIEQRNYNILGIF